MRHGDGGRGGKEPFLRLQHGTTLDTEKIKLNEDHLEARNAAKTRK